MYVRNDLYAMMVRVYAPKEENTIAEVIKLQKDTVPPTNIFGVYLETGELAGIRSTHTITLKKE